MRYKNGHQITLTDDEYKPREIRKNNIRLAGWKESQKTGEELEFEETFNDMLSGTIYGASEQDTPYYREAEGNPLLIQDNLGTELEKCEILGKSEQVNDYVKSEGLSTQEADYVYHDGVSTQQSSVWGTNLLENSNFSIDSDSNGVADGFRTHTGIKSLLNNVQSWTPTAQFHNMNLATLPNCIIGHKYFFSCWVKTSSSITILFYTGDGGSWESTPAITDSNWHKYSQTYVIMGSNAEPYIQDGKTVEFTELQTKYWVLIDLTKEFGAGKEPTAAQMDAMLAQYPNSWFDGKALLTTDTVTYTPNSPSPDYPSPIYNTKNLFDARTSQYTTGYYLDENGNQIALSSAIIYNTPIYVVGGIKYSWMRADSRAHSFLVYCYDREGNWISRLGSGSSGSITGTITLPLNCYYINFGLSKDTDKFSIQIEKRDSPTPYEPFIGAGSYKHTAPNGDIFEFTLADDIRGINSVQDRVCFDRKSGIGWLDKKIGKYLITGSESWYEHSSILGFFYNTGIVSNVLGSHFSIISKCTHYEAVSYNSRRMDPPSMSMGGEGNPDRILLYDYRFIGNVPGLKTWLLAQNSSGNPVIVTYQLKNPTCTPIVFTKVASSTLPEFPVSALVVTEPSPEYPIGIYPYAKAGTYKITCPNGEIYETNLAEDMHGIGGYRDKIFFDRQNGKGWRDTRTENKTLTSANNWSAHGLSTDDVLFMQCWALGIITNGTTSNVASSHFKTMIGRVHGTGYISGGTFLCSVNRSMCADTEAFKAWLDFENLVGRPMVVTIPVSVPTRSELTFTKVASSTAPELPASVLEQGGGRNKFNKDNITADKYIDHTTGTVTTDSNNNNVTELIPVSASQLTISGHTFIQPVDSNIGLAWYTAEQTFISGVSFADATGNGTYTRPANAAYVRYTVNDVDLGTSQLEEGAVANPYESYFVPNTPNPNYPVAITKVESPTLQACGKNITSILDHNITLSDEYCKNYLPQTPKIVLFPNTKYTVAFDYVVNSATSYVHFAVGYGVSSYSVDITSSVRYPNQTQGRVVHTFTTPASFKKQGNSPAIDTPYLWLRFARMSVRGSLNVDISNVIIAYGEHAYLPYEPYSGVTLPYTPAPLYCLPNGIFDKINVLRGVERHDIGIKVFDGTNIWNSYSNGMTDTFSEFYTTTSIIDCALGYQLSSCTHFKNVSGGFDAPTVERYSDHTTVARKYFIVKNDRIGVLSSDDSATRLTKWLAYLASEYAKGTPVTVIYQKATPTETALTPQAVPLVAQYTNIFVDKLADVKVGYKIDTAIKTESDILSPTPDYPQVIRNASGNVGSKGRNLFDEISDVHNMSLSMTYENGMATSTILVGGYYSEITLTQEANERIFKPNKSYTFFADSDSTKNIRCELVLRGDRQGGELSQIKTGINGKNYVQITVVDDWINRSFAVIRFNRSSVPATEQRIKTYTNIRIIEGLYTDEDIPAFTPYHAPTSILVPETPSIKLDPTAVDYTYIDSAGNKRLADTYTYLGGDMWEKRQRIYCTHVSLCSGISGSKYYTTLVTPLAAYTPKTYILSDKLKYRYAYSFIANTAFCIYDGNRVYWNIASSAAGKSIIDGQTELTAIGGFDIYYILATPLVTQVSLGQLKTFPRYTKIEQDGTLKPYLNLTAKIPD